MVDGSAEVSYLVNSIGFAPTFKGVKGTTTGVAIIPAESVSIAMKQKEKGASQPALVGLPGTFAQLLLRERRWIPPFYTPTVAHYPD